MMKKYVIFQIVILFFSSAIVLAQDRNCNSLILAGRYIGIVPCFNCPGISTVLIINEDGCYKLAETYLGENKKTFYSSGKFIFDVEKKGGIYITLLMQQGEKRSYQICDGSLVQINMTEKVDGIEYRLFRQDEFNGDGKQLYVNPESVIHISGKGTDIIQFKSLVNFYRIVQYEYKSLTAIVEIDCRKRTVVFSEVTFFDQHDADGEKLTLSCSRDGARELSKNIDDVFMQAAKRYCPAKKAGSKPLSSKQVTQTEKCL